MEKDSTAFKILAIFLGLSFFMGEGLNYSQLGPFFPTEARENKGVSTTFIGIITGVFDVSLLFSAFIFANIISPQNQKFFFCTGALLSASCNALFGIMGYSVGGTPFIVICTLVRALMGVGASMVWSTGVPMVVAINPLWAGRITSLIESSLGLGLMLGPPIGSALYSVGGYATPFLVAAGVQICFAIVCIFLLPNKAAEMETNSESIPNKPKDEKELELPGYIFFYYITRPFVLAACVPVLLHAASMTFLDVAVGPYLKDVFDVSGDTSGYYFLAYSAVYACLAPLLGSLVDRGHAGQIFLVSCYTGALAFAMLWLPQVLPSVESKLWLICWLALLAPSNSGGFIAVYLIYEKLAYSLRFRVENNAKLMTAAILNACTALGRILGSIVIGGVFMESYGFYNSALVLFCAFLFSGFISVYCLLRANMLNRIYYPKDGDSEQLIVNYEEAIESSGGNS